MKINEELPVIVGSSCALLIIELNQIRSVYVFRLNRGWSRFFLDFFLAYFRFQSLSTPIQNTMPRMWPVFSGRLVVYQALYKAAYQSGISNGIWCWPLYRPITGPVGKTAFSTLIFKHLAGQCNCWRNLFERRSTTVFTILRTGNNDFTSRPFIKPYIIWYLRSHLQDL